MISLKDGIRSLVRIDFQGNVHKQFRGTDADKRCANEVRVLRALEERGCIYVPQLLESFPKKNCIVTTNCGRTAEQTISKKKADSLFAELEEKYGIRHDDPEPRNITYDDRLGRFCIIDFELAEILSRPAEAVRTKTRLTRLHWASGTQQGRRHLTNQDSYSSFTINSQGHVNSADHGEIIMPARFASFAISDGVGGNNGGEFASRLVLNIFKYQVENKTTLLPLNEEKYTKLLQKTHAALNDKAEENAHASKLSATFVGMIFQGDKILWANVGDSRLYRMRDGELTQLSNDHNFAFRQWKRGEMREIQYRMHPRKNILFDSMGGQHESISPECGSDSWQAGDRYLLCSDGIIDGLADRKIASILKGEDIQIQEEAHTEICESLLDQATANAGDDDTTLIVIDTP